LTILYPAKSLFWFGYAFFLILALPANLVADDLPPPAAAPDAGPLPNNPAKTSSAGNSQSTDNSSQSSSNSSSPDSTQAPANSQSANTPLLPQQGSNPYSPLSSSDTFNQSSQLTTPGLNTTGGYDLSQIATNTALLEAFSQPLGYGNSSESGGDLSTGPIERIRLGPLNLKFSLTTTVVSDDNILGSNANSPKLSDTSFNLTPAILLEYGAHEGQKGYASLVYAPTLTRYFQHSDENSDNQNVAFNARYPFQKLTLDLAQTYTQVTGVNQDLNARTTQTSSVTSVGGNYEIDDKLTFTSHFKELITRFSQGQGQGDTISSINSSLSYHLSEKMTLGPVFNVGLERPQGATKQTFEQAFLGLNYQVTEKISLAGQGGFEFRQYDAGGDNTNPVFGAVVAYTPFDATNLSVNVNQNVQASSADSQQTSVNTDVGFNATQRFVQKFYLGFSFDYSHTEYQDASGNPVQSNGNSNSSSSSFGSTQDNLVYRPSLSYIPSQWLSVAVYYQYRDNESQGSGGGFHDNQLGLTVSAQF
jgi:hypothetical protein